MIYPWGRFVLFYCHIRAGVKGGGGEVRSFLVRGQVV